MVSEHPGFCLDPPIRSDRKWVLQAIGVIRNFQMPLSRTVEIRLGFTCKYVVGACCFTCRKSFLTYAKTKTSLKLKI